MDFFHDIIESIERFFGYGNPPLDDNDEKLNKFYSSTFRAICYTRHEIPKNYLPYGLISNPDKYIDRLTDDLNPREFFREVYEDCLSYLNGSLNGEEPQWHLDFIVFCNLQISIYNDPKLINDQEFELLINFTAKHVRNLRSYVARNANLFVECLTYSLEDDKMFFDFCFKIIPQLFICSSSEKMIYRESSINNLKLITSRCSKIFNQEILWIYLQHTISPNIKISSVAAEFTSQYLLNTNKDDFETLDISKFLGFLDKGLSSRNIDVKRNLKQIVTKLPDLLSEQKLSLFLDQSVNFPMILDVVKKEFPSK